MGDLTEYEFLSRREHIERKGYLILVALTLEPSYEIGEVQHPDRGYPQQPEIPD